MKNDANTGQMKTALYNKMSAQGSATTILKEIARGVLKATDIPKVVNA